MRYRTIVADPPWPIGNRPGWKWRAGRPSGDERPLDYPLMGLDEIKDLPVRQLAQADFHFDNTNDRRDGSVLYLWATTEFLCAAHDVACAWGFGPSAVLVWCKRERGFNVGGTFPSNVEFIIYGRRGSPPRSGTALSRWFQWPRGRHSQKPEAFYDLVERISPGPYLELFARRNRLGWDTWGNEALNHVELGGRSG
jgi:N6-adenosine-specific RNA methylase IME4